MDDFEEIDPSLPLASISNTELTIVDQESSTDEDYKKSRDNIYELIEQGKEGIEVALAIAKDTESPRSIEVFFSGLKTLADINLQLLDINKKKIDASTAHSRENEADVITNQTINQTAIFAGTTAELAKLLKDMKNE